MQLAMYVCVMLHTCVTECCVFNVLLTLTTLSHGYCGYLLSYSLMRTVKTILIQYIIQLTIYNRYAADITVIIYSVIL